MIKRFLTWESTNWRVEICTDRAWKGYDLLQGKKIERGKSFNSAGSEAGHWWLESWPAWCCLEQGWAGKTSDQAKVCEDQGSTQSEDLCPKFRNIHMFLEATWLRYNLHAFKFTCFKYAIQWFPANLSFLHNHDCPTVLEHSHHSNMTLPLLYG